MQGCVNGRPDVRFVAFGIMSQDMAVIVGRTELLFVLRPDLFASNEHGDIGAGGPCLPDGGFQCFPLEAPGFIVKDRLVYRGRYGEKSCRHVFSLLSLMNWLPLIYGFLNSSKHRQGVIR